MASHIGRRKFLTTLGGAAVAWPLTAHAQQPARVPTVGFLVAGTPSTHGQWLAAFVRRLGELGWVEGRNIAIEVRWAEGHSGRLAEIASEFVRLKVDVIVTHSAKPVLAVKQATSVIPIVFGTGLVTTLAGRGGNVTGLSMQMTDLAGKRLEILREVTPGLRRLAIMLNVGARASVLEMSEVQATARTLGIDVTTVEVRRAEDIGSALKALEGRADALYVCADPLLTTSRTRIAISAVGARLPTMHGFREYVEAGGLMSYGPSFEDLWRHTGDFVDKILRGAKPGDIPVEQPTKFDLIINLTTAKALGLTISESFLLRADEVIE
jgi:putative ABC transport system substrate-binding protein